MEGPPLEEPDLVVRARDGYSAAFGQLVQQYQELAFRTAFLIAGDSAEAEDAAQEAILKAYNALDRFRPEAAFRTLAVANRGQCGQESPTGGRWRAQLALRASSASSSAAKYSSPEAAALEEQRRELLARVNQLHDDDRLAIASRYFLELSEAETAAAMGCAPGTVKSRLQASRRKLHWLIASTRRPIPPGGQLDVPDDVPEDLLAVAMDLCGECDLRSQFQLGLDLMLQGLQPS